MFPSRQTFEGTEDTDLITPHASVHRCDSNEREEERCLSVLVEKRTDEDMEFREVSGTGQLFDDLSGSESMQGECHMQYRNLDFNLLYMRHTVLPKNIHIRKNRIIP